MSRAHSATMLAFACLAGFSLPAAQESAPRRPVHTFSIVARDAQTGEIGVAVQSHWFQVGVDVIWAEAGVGAVATQSFIEPAYGPKGLALMRAGNDATEALAKLIKADPARELRQVAMVDARGGVGAWTGSKCIQAAGDLQGASYSVQANLMEQKSVWPAMARAFESSEGEELAERLLRALEAAQAEGGDIRGRQSAALLVVKAKGSGEVWNDRIVDLRVDDAPAPLAELRRLLAIHRAYAAMNVGDAAMAAGDLPAAKRAYAKAAARCPESEEIRYWQAITLFAAGDTAEALAILDPLFNDPRWVELTRRLPPSGLLSQEDSRKILAIVDD